MTIGGLPDGRDPRGIYPAILNHISEKGRTLYRYDEAAGRWFLRTSTSRERSGSTTATARITVKTRIRAGWRKIQWYKACEEVWWIMEVLNDEETWHQTNSGSRNENDPNDVREDASRWDSKCLVKRKDLSRGYWKFLMAWPSWTKAD